MMSQMSPLARARVILPMMFVLVSGRALISPADISADVPVPTHAQAWYQQAEIHALIHFNMATFGHDGDPGCDQTNWNPWPCHNCTCVLNETIPTATYKCCNDPNMSDCRPAASWGSKADCDAACVVVNPTADPATFRPEKLNTSQWADVMVALGAKGAILTAKHGCGHLLWPTDTKLPNGERYPYSVGQSQSFIKTDVLAAFAASMGERGIGHGFYYSLTNNFFLNVYRHVANASSHPLPGQQNITQAEFEAIALAQVTELWTRYGNLSEIWFDGGYTSDMADQLKKVLAKQPNAVGFGGLGISPNPASWVGTESGAPKCPNGLWSLQSDTGDVCGDPEGSVFDPKTCDTTLQNGDRWFWNPPATGIRNLADLIKVYHNTVGSNGVMELDFAIDRDGLVSPEHEAAYRQFGGWIRSCYGTPVPGSLVTGPTPTGTGPAIWTFELTLSGAGGEPMETEVDRVVVREDITKGQRIRSFSVDTLAVGSETWSFAEFEGTAVGNRKVALLARGAARLSKIRLSVATIGVTVPPVLLSFHAFQPCPSS